MAEVQLLRHRARPEDVSRGAAAAEPRTLATENTLPSRQWAVLPHLSSTAKAHSGEWDPMQLMGGAIARSLAPETAGCKSVRVQRTELHDYGFTNNALHAQSSRVA
ncbi:hypothetical protein QYF61_015539 [Mycteria americana]|uniref:Uncharacterized protein n=1 Tax=Mycteria americana TaxID=33587 RepID=A0AAN7P8R4_MYCAM|nr:hypothetical protein QYF61_015538 [Mycteria americana]KAK4822533.1 hypothetical protein QYF61_015539 [Mycteria americana]